MDKVILVDERDRETGQLEKMAAHREGRLHRCFSIFIFNGKGELLLQQRAASKYHSGGLWTNTCCSHPRLGELVLNAAHRRLMEEMGFDCPLEEKFTFIYKSRLDHDLIEHEFDHVFFGEYKKDPKPDPAEVGDWKRVDLVELKKEATNHPEHYTEWLKIILPKVISIYRLP